MRTMAPPKQAISSAVEFDNVKKKLEQLAGAVLEQLRALQTAVARRNVEELHQIVKRDKEIDDLDLSLERIGKSFMELRAPLGPDFRYIMGALDISRNLERIGDCIEYVARHVSESLKMSEEFKEASYIIESMIEKDRDILEMAFTSWLRSDAALARRIPEQDDFVDAMQERAYSLVIKEVRAGTVDVEMGMMAMLICNKLESIADIACHIAESVVFMIQAQQIRHETK